MGIIHMNGRIYDAKTGRFLQADPYIDGVTYTQGFNRYSYVHNNPLNATDPTGYFNFKSLYKAEMKISGRWDAHKFTGKHKWLHRIGMAALSSIPFFGPLASAHAGFDHALANGGDWEAALGAGFIAGISSFAFSQIGTGYTAGTLNLGQAVVAAGAVGGITAKLQGGKFGHGFVSAGVGFAVGVVGESYAWPVSGRIVAATVVGGTVSRMTGGKFANGAAFAAFAAILQSGVAAATNNGSGNQTPQQTNPTSSQTSTQSQAQLSGMSKVLSVVGDVVGKIWNLPNTIIGATIGGVGHVVGEIGQFFGLYNMEPTISFGNNAIQFENNPFTPAGGLTVGNAIIYGGGATPTNIGFHEAQHTYQGQVLGPFYLPLNLLGQAASLTTYPVVSWRGPSPVHGKANFMEVGPLSTPSRPTPWK